MSGSYWNQEDDTNIICPYCGKKYCGCCKHWKRKGVKKIGDKPTSYGKCTKLSISGFEVETTFNDDCSSEGLN